MDFELQNQLRDFIERDERLLWVGKPKSGFVLRSFDAILIPFSLLWFGFALFWEYMAWKMDAGMFMLFGLPFILVGLYICVGRFFADMARRKNTIYGITTERVIIRSGIFNMDTKSINIKNITDLILSEKKDGYGTILFGATSTGTIAFNTLNTWQGSKSVNGFELIPDAKKVYNILVERQKA